MPPERGGVTVDMSEDNTDNRQSALLAAIDERTKNTAVLLREIKDAMVTKETLNARMKPVEAITYGLTGIILLAVIGAVVALVLV